MPSKFRENDLRNVFFTKRRVLESICNALKMNFEALIVEKDAQKTFSSVHLKNALTMQKALTIEIGKMWFRANRHEKLHCISKLIEQISSWIFLAQHIYIWYFHIFVIDRSHLRWKYWHLHTDRLRKFANRQSSRLTLVDKISTEKNLLSYETTNRSNIEK